MLREKLTSVQGCLSGESSLPCLGCSLRHGAGQNSHQVSNTSESQPPVHLQSSLTHRAAGIARENLEDIAQLDVHDNGKSIWEAR